MTPAAKGGDSHRSAAKELARYLAERGLTPEDVANYHPVPMVSHLPGVKLRGAGIGFEIRYPDVSGAGYIEGLSRARVTDPIPPLDREGKAVRYTQAAASGSHLYVPVRMVRSVRAALCDGGNGERLLVTEGEVKADKAAKHGAPLVVGIQGIDGASAGEGRVLPLLARLAAGRVVLLAPDGDAKTNPNVRRGLDRLVAALRQAGAREIRVLSWAAGKGLDDHLHLHGPGANEELQRLMDSAVEATAPLGNLVSLDVSTEPAPVNWHWHNAIPAGRVGVFAGPGGMGKTNLLSGLAVHRALGRSFLGRAVRRGPTLIVSAEDGVEDFGAALASYRVALNLNSTEVATVNAAVALLDVVGAGFKLASGDFKVAVDDGAVAQLVARISEAVSVRSWAPSDLLVVLETYSRLSPGEDNEAAAAVVTAAERITREVRGVTVMITHHQSKAANKSGDSDSTGARGGQALSDNARFLLLLTKLPPSDAGKEGAEEAKRLAVFSCAKVNRAPPQEPTRLQRVSVQLRDQAGWVFALKSQASLTASSGDVRGALKAQRDEEALLLAALRATVQAANDRGEEVTATKVRKGGAGGLLESFAEKCGEYGVRAPRKCERVNDLVDRALATGHLIRGGKSRGGGFRLTASTTTPPLSLALADGGEPPGPQGQGVGCGSAA